MELTKQQIEKMFHSALCNGLGYLGGYGLQLDYYPEKYNEAKQKLDDPCYEDVLMQMLKDGEKLYIIDTEFYHEPDGYEKEFEGYDSEISLNDVYERLPYTPKYHLEAMLEGHDDAETADAILQTVFYMDIIFG